VESKLRGGTVRPAGSLNFLGYFSAYNEGAKKNYLPRILRTISSTIAYRNIGQEDSVENVYYRYHKNVEWDRGFAKKKSPNVKNQRRIINQK
jgi:hypothetical protein